MQTPYRFRTKRRLWACVGLALKIHTSGEYRFERRQLKRSKKAPAIRGPYRNHNHGLKNVGPRVEPGFRSIVIGCPSPCTIGSAGC